MLKKFFAALIIIGNLLFASVVDAEIKTYTATSEELASKLESEEIVKLRALNKAIKIASEQVAIDLKNFELNDEEISAIIAGSYELGEVKYTQADSTCQATIEIKFDDVEAKNWIQRDDREKFMLMNQTAEAQKLFETNELKVKQLRERIEQDFKKQYKKIFKDEFEYLNKDFLSIQKLSEGNKFAYRGRFEDAINFYKEAIELNSYNAAAYNRRGNIYSILSMQQKNIPIAESNRRQAIRDFEVAIRLNQAYSDAFTNRGLFYYDAKNYSTAIKDFNRAIQLEPNHMENYIYRAQCTRQTDGNAALADFNKAIELAPNMSYGYSSRGNFYEYDLKDFSKALEDYTRAIELERRENFLPIYYNSRGSVYQKLNMYDKAIEDYTRAISQMESAEQKNSLLAWVYRSRGECYKALGDNSQAQSDLNKFGELQRR